MAKHKSKRGLRGSRQRRKDRHDRQIAPHDPIDVHHKMPDNATVTPAHEAAADAMKEEVPGEGLRPIPKVRRTRQLRRKAEREARERIHYELHESGYSREERRALRKELQRRDAEDNRLLAEGRQPPERTEDLDELLEELQGG